MEARVTSHSQGYQLRERMAQADIQHGQEVRADLPGIRVTALDRFWFSERKRGQIFFCTMGPIRIREVLVPGDGGRLPSDVVVEGLEVPGRGTYDLLNAVVQTNGRLRLLVDDATQVVRAPGEWELAAV